MHLPFYIISHDNTIYIENTLKQLADLEYPEELIHIVDNASLCKNIVILKKLNKKYNKIYIHYLQTNIGPRIYKYKELLNLPDKFILTDPDLQYNPEMPKNFCEILHEISVTYQCYKVGLALKIDDYPLFVDAVVHRTEIPYWKNKVNSDKYNMYYSQIDTTFCLINEDFKNSTMISPKKKKKVARCIRVADNFTASHIPWYRKSLLNDGETYNMYCNNPWSKLHTLVFPSLHEKYNMVLKNDVHILFPKSFLHNFDSWNNKTVDEYLSYEKDVIVIGDFIGETLYVALKSNDAYIHHFSQNMFDTLNEFASFQVRNIKQTLVGDCFKLNDNIDYKNVSCILCNESNKINIEGISKFYKIPIIIF